MEKRYTSSYKYKSKLCDVCFEFGTQNPCRKCAQALEISKPKYHKQCLKCKRKIQSTQKQPDYLKCSICKTYNCYKCMSKQVSQQHLRLINCNQKKDKSKLIKQSGMFHSSYPQKKYSKLEFVEKIQNCIKCKQIIYKPFQNYSQIYCLHCYCLKQDK